MVDIHAYFFSKNHTFLHIELILYLQLVILLCFPVKSGLIQQFFILS